MGQLFEHWDSGPDEALIEQGRKEGRAEERKNTEAERKRADEAEAEIKRLQDEISRLKTANQ